MAHFPPGEAIRGPVEIMSTDLDPELSGSLTDPNTGPCWLKHGSPKAAFPKASVWPQFRLSVSTDMAAGQLGRIDKDELLRDGARDLALDVMLHIQHMYAIMNDY